MSANPEKPRRRRRWWVRIARGALMLLILLVLLVSGALWWVYSRRVILLNDALASVGPLQGNVGAFEVSAAGSVELHDLVFKDRASGTVVARVPYLSGQANLAKLPPEEVRVLTLKEPEITLTAGMLDAWRKLAAANRTAGERTAPAIPFGIRFAKLNIEDAHVHFEQGDGSSATVTLSYHGEDIDVKPGGLNTGDQELGIDEGAVKAGATGEAPFAVQKLRVKGRVRDGVVHLANVELERPSLRLTPHLLAMFGIDFTPDGDDAKSDPGTTAAASTGPKLVRGFRIDNVAVHDGTLNARGFAAANATGLSLPDTSAKASYEAQGIEWHDGEQPVIASQDIDLQEVSIDAPGDKGHIRFHSGSFDFATAGRGAPWVIESLVLTKPDIWWTPQLRELLTFRQPPAAAAPASPAPQPQPAPAEAPDSMSALLLKQVAVTDGSVAITDPALMPFELHTNCSLRLANLLMDGRGLHSQSFQTLEVTETRLAFPSANGQPAKTPWLELPHGEAVVKPDDWNDRTRMARLALEKLVVRLRDGNTPWDSSVSLNRGPQPTTAGPTEAKEVAGAPPAPGTESGEPWWKRINCGQLSVRQGTIDLLVDAPKPVDMKARVDITTQRMQNGGSQHTVRIADLTAKLPTLSPTPFPVAQVAMLEGVVRLPEMWTERHFDQLHLSGASVDMSEALLKLFEPEKTAAPAPAAVVTRQAPEAGGQKHSPWAVGDLNIQNSSVTVTNLVPGMPAVKFGVSLEVKDTPLLAEDLAKNVEPQRIELHDLKIPSPNGTARYVAELDSIFVSFSLGGLMRKEIDGIEIVSPTLFVGEDLFWYVDFYRKYAERGAQPAARSPRVAANDDELEHKLAAQVAAAEPSISQASWSVKRLQVHSGKLMLAPKGVPLKGFRTPFPFHIDSEVTRGTLNADMEIPSDTYELPDVNLQFVGMTGRVQFNLPLKQKDNNLVETFEVDNIRWKGIRTGKAYLTVTYDSGGIYSKFGADAYEGYLSGEFNLYTDDSFHWDGWVNGKGVQMRELTRILCPGYFVMDGKVEATLVAQGSKDELYQADGSFLNESPGKFTISALNGMIDDLPAEWDPLKVQITKIGLETLRDFKYDHAEMKCRFYGREGNGKLLFSGPEGSRNFDVNVYDHRWSTDDHVQFQVTTARTKGE